VAERLLARGERVIGVDDFNAYYDPALKAAGAARLEANPDFRMMRLDIAEAEAFERLVRESGAVQVVHLAAQAGVRYSIKNPFADERSNLAGHLSVMEACRRQPGFNIWSTRLPVRSMGTDRRAGRGSARMTRPPSPSPSMPPPSGPVS
jgi:nucleoside-diphosphate-sugar epimerase